MSSSRIPLGPFFGSFFVPFSNPIVLPPSTGAPPRRTRAETTSPTSSGTARNTARSSPTTASPRPGRDNTRGAFSPSSTAPSPSTSAPSLAARRRAGMCGAPPRSTGTVSSRPTAVGGTVSASRTKPPPPPLLRRPQRQPLLRRLRHPPQRPQQPQQRHRPPLHPQLQKTPQPLEVAAEAAAAVMTTKWSARALTTSSSGSTRATRRSSSFKTLTRIPSFVFSATSSASKLSGRYWLRGLPQRGTERNDLSCNQLESSQSFIRSLRLILLK